MKQKNCLITGATGALGPSVVAAFETEGYRVSILCRKEPEHGLFSQGVRVILGDILELDKVSEAVKGQDVIVHLASLLHKRKPTAAEQNEIKLVNVSGTENLVLASQRENVSRFLLASTIAVYGYGQKICLRETSATHPETIYGTTKIEAENIVLNAKRSDGSPLATVLRLSAVYGPRVKGNYQTLLHGLARGRFVPVGDGKNRRTLVHTDDVARAFCVVAEIENAAGNIYNVTDGEHHELQKIIEAMCQALGRGTPRVALPVPPIRGVLSTADFLVSLTGKRLDLSGMLEKYLEEVVVEGKKIQEIGFEPRIKLREGWAETVRQLRDSGQL